MIPGKQSVPIRGTAALLAACLLVLSAVFLDAKPRDQERWDKKYDTEKYLFGKKPIRFLVDNVGLLPKGKVLDIAMGEGRNGVYLASQGFDVLGLDISDVGLQKARKLAAAHGVKIETRVVDLESHQLEKNAYDVVIDTYYLQRDLFPQIKEALKSGGMAVVETYNTNLLKYRRFNKDYLLKPDELRDIFKDFKIIRYQEVDDGKTAYSSLIAQKP